jgi:hypothetical protein
MASFERIRCESGLSWTVKSFGGNAPNTRRLADSLSLLKPDIV